MTFDNFTYKGVKFSQEIHSEKQLSYLENEFKVFDDDVYCVTFPKSGTHWMGEILNLIKNKGDPTECNTVLSMQRSPWFECITGLPDVENLARPRIISSHLPCHVFAKSVFESKAKVLYTIRNPKDVFVSRFHFNKMLKIYKDERGFQDSLNDFLQGNIMFGSWFDHVKGWLQMTKHENFFYITYEELQQDLRGSVVRICKFLGKELNDEEIDSVVKHSTFDTMKENKMCNGDVTQAHILDKSKGTLMRKGISGDWKNHLTVAQSEYFDKVYQEKMKDVNVKFSWEEN
ncbi:hypothetical protein GDO86_012423 [Hymenochirus boettgeri]|uniref:Sulfotransferase n=1 Tax=Hymenochirus boettgeri TaxID=247094 RepID=A0A8T2ISU9_9PIPI|nr:hypothetical protein GDO86_012423 [Hymenochirus boettgeri]